MKKFLKHSALILMIIVTVLAFPMTAVADFGDFAGDDDYGGYDDYDDYDSDYGGYDDDDDYSYGGGGSGGGSSGDGDMLGVLVTAAVFGVIFLIIYRAGNKNQKRKKVIPSGNVPGAGGTPTTGLMPVEAIRQWDPNFSEQGIKERVSKLYVQMQNCWTAKDITPLRGDFTDSQFAQYDRQLQRYRDEKQTSIIERIAVLDVSLAGVKQDNTNDVLVVNLSTRITEYTVDDKTGQIVRGDRSKEKFMRYEWTFVRPKGTQTGTQSKDSTVNCPNCGATLDINQSAKCPYCDSVISMVQYDWVIAGIKGLSQRTL